MMDNEMDMFAQYICTFAQYVNVDFHLYFGFYTRARLTQFKANPSEFIELT